MNKDFFESQEFQDKLASYEMADRLGQQCYFDTEDFVDISDYYLDRNQPDNAMHAITQGLLIHKGNNHLLTIKAGILIYKHQFQDALDIMNQIPTIKIMKPFTFMLSLSMPLIMTSGNQKIYSANGLKKKRKI